MPKFTYANGLVFTAEDQVDDVLINPKLPRRFDDTPNEVRPGSHAKWRGFPYIVTETVEALDAYYAGRTDEYAAAGLKMWKNEGRAKWMQAWPSGTRYTVRCLDGGAWDRSTNWGSFPTLAAAVECANTGPSWRYRG